MGKQTPMDKDAASRMRAAAARDPESAGAKTGADRRAQSAADQRAKSGADRRRDHDGADDADTEEDEAG